MKKKIFISVFTILGVFLLGWLVKDRYFLGSITLCFGMIQVTLMMKGSWRAELLALLETLFSVFIYFSNGLFGTVVFTVLVYLPMGVYSVFAWKNNQQNGIVKVNKFTLKTSLLVTSSLLLFTVLVSFLLSLIPGQSLSFLDSLSNGFNISGLILLALRYKEGWYFWICCNIVEIINWCIMISNGAANSIMMLIICIVYIVLDVFGIRAFLKLRHNQEDDKIDDKNL